MIIIIIIIIIIITKKTHSVNDDCYHHYHYNQKNIIFSIRNNELTHYMSIFVISLIRDRTKTRAEATVGKNLAQQKNFTYFLIKGIQPKKDLKFKNK